MVAAIDGYLPPRRETLDLEFIPTARHSNELVDAVMKASLTAIQPTPHGRVLPCLEKGRVSI